jgi:hypothetical protein
MRKTKEVLPLRFQARDTEISFVDVGYQFD